MSRHTNTVTITAEKSRDKGKTYVITEMDAEAAEWWAFRVLQALLGKDADVDMTAPLAQMARQGLKALATVPSDQAKPLLDEMMGCVSMQIPGGQPRAMLPGDIEEVSTRVKLRAAVLELHVGFFDLGGALTGG